MGFYTYMYVNVEIINYSCICFVFPHTGGHDGLSIFCSVERYDPELQQWSFVSDMQSKRCRLGVTSSNGKLFRYAIDACMYECDIVKL